jgi:hypothetical protein
LTKTNALSVDPNIRRTITSDVGLEDQGPGFAQKVLYQGPDAPKPAATSGMENMAAPTTAMPAQVAAPAAVTPAVTPAPPAGAIPAMTRPESAPTPAAPASAQP